MKKYKCTNPGNCEKANEQEIIELADSAPDLCPECGEPLEKHTGSSISSAFSLGRNAKMGAFGLLGVLVLGGIIYWATQPTVELCKKTTLPQLPYVALRDTTFCVKDKAPIALKSGETLIREGKGYKILPAGVLPPTPTPTNTNPQVAAPCNGMGAGRLAAIGQSNEFKVGFDDAYSTLYNNNTTAPTGFAYEIAKLVAVELGAQKITPRAYNTTKTAEAIKKAEVDAVFGIGIKDPTIPNVVWSDPYVESGLCLLVKNGSGITDTSQLVGKKVLIWKEANGIIKRLAQRSARGASIIETNDANWFQQVENGQVDAIMIDYVRATAERRRFPNVKIVSFNIAPINYSVMLPCNNTDLLDKVNRALSNIKTSRDYGRLYNTHLRENTIPSGNSTGVRPQYTITPEELARLPTGTSTHTVRSGESLSIIAQQMYNNSPKWRIIWIVNRGRIPDPNLIMPGDVIIMPTEQQLANISIE